MPPLAVNKPSRSCVLQAVADAECAKRQQELEKEEARQRAKEWAEQEPVRREQREAARLAREQEKLEKLEQEKRERTERQAREKAVKAEADRASLNDVEAALAKGLASVNADSLTTSHLTMLVTLVRPDSDTHAAASALRTLRKLPTARMDEVFQLGAIAALIPLLGSEDNRLAVAAARCLSACIDRPGEEEHTTTFLTHVARAAADAGAIPPLARKAVALLAAVEKRAEDGDLSYVLWALLGISYGNEEAMRREFGSAGLSSLAGLLCDNRSRSRQAAVQVLQRLCNGGDAAAEAILNALPDDFFPLQSPMDFETERYMNHLLDTLVPAARRKIESYAFERSNLHRRRSACPLLTTPTFDPVFAEPTETSTPPCSSSKLARMQSLCPRRRGRQCVRCSRNLLAGASWGCRRCNSPMTSSVRSRTRR